MDKKKAVDYCVDIIRKHYFISFTVLFIIAKYLVFYPFVLYSKSFVMYNDGLWQHFTALMYYGKWLRSIPKALLHGAGLSIPLWDFSIGYGNDVITTFAFYCLGDPLALLSAIVPAKHTEQLYNFLVVLRLYLAGIAFSLYCIKHKKNKVATLAGALVYSFCGWAMYGGTRHPFFANPMIYLPILMLGFDKVFKKDSPILFILSVAVAAMSNFYFFYMLVIFLIIYALYCFFTTEHEDATREFLSLLGRSMLYGCIGVAIAGVIFSPIVIAAVNTPRTGNTVFDLVYSRLYYEQSFAAFITTDIDSLSWREQAYAAPALLAVFALFTRKDKRALKIVFVLLTLFFLIPAAGNVLNGFKYASNRWSWAYSALVAYILVDEWDDLVHADQRTKVVLTVASLSYMFCAMLATHGRTQGFFAAAVVLFVSLCAILLLSDVQELRNQSANALQVALLTLVLIAVAINGGYRFGLTQRNYVDRYVNKGEAYKKVTNKTDTKLAKLSRESGFQRYDRESTHIMNTSVIRNGYTVESYWSLTSPYVIQFMSEMEMSGKWLPSRYHDLDARAYLEKIAAVKYYLADTYGHEPYAYRFLQDKGEKSIYADTNALPLGYTYGTYIPRSVYDKLPSYDKQQAVMQGAVLDDEVLGSLPESVTQADVELEATRHNVEVTAGDGIYQPDSQHYLVKKKGAFLTVTFEGRPECETYLHIKGLQAEPCSKYDLYMDEYDKQLSQKAFNRLEPIEQEQLKYDDVKLINERENIFMMEITANGRTRKLEYTTPYYSGAKTQTDYLANLGYSDEGLTEATIMLPLKGVYTIEDIEVVCQPMDKLNDYARVLKQDVLKDVRIGTNSVEGSIHLDQGKVLCLAIPYDKGWTAKVDGKDVDLLVVNTMFTGIPLTEGDHTIELTYRTPGLLAGIAMTVLGVAATAFLARKYRRG